MKQNNSIEILVYSFKNIYHKHGAKIAKPFFHKFAMIFLHRRCFARPGPRPGGLIWCKLNFCCLPSGPERTHLGNQWDTLFDFGLSGVNLEIWSAGHEAWATHKPHPMQPVGTLWGACDVYWYYAWWVSGCAHCALRGLGPLSSRGRAHSCRVPESLIDYHLVLIAPSGKMPSRSTRSGVLGCALPPDPSSATHCDTEGCH